MSWQPHQNVEGKGKRVCKIRKRGCCSSSSSSSLIQKYRFKRAVLVRKRADLATPVPNWLTATIKSPSLSIPSFELSPSSAFKTKEASVSARKLAATLWEINKMAHTLPPTLSDPSYSPISEKMDRPRIKAHKRRSSVVPQKLQMTDYKLGSYDSVSVDNASLMEVETHSRGKNHAGGVIGSGTRLKDVRNGLTTSKELLKVLNHVCGLEERHSSTMSLISALRVELDRARHEVDQLIRERRSNCDETEYLMRHFAEEKAAWKRKERERVRDAISCVAEELEVEKKLRRQTERLNKKLGKELADTKALLSKATKELDSETRAREIMEQVCDEFAKGIGEDRATTEETKRESAKVRQEVEKEREMLHFADVLREERVQMKLSEAKHHFEEKNAVVEKLRNELEAYLGTKIDEGKVDGSPHLQRIKELEAYLKNIGFGTCQDVDKGEVMVNGEECEADDSADSDLHSIELNMDTNDKSYKWSYARGNHVEGESKTIPIRKENNGMKCQSEKLSWESNYLEGRSSDSTDWDYEDEIKRYRSVKSLRDHILSSNKIAPIGSFSSPTRKWSQSMHFPEHSSNDSPVSKGHDLKQHKVVCIIGEGRTSTS